MWTVGSLFLANLTSAPKKTRRSQRGEGFLAMAQTLEVEFRKTREEVGNDRRKDRGRATLRDRLGKRFKRTLFGIGLVLILAVGGLYFFAKRRAMSRRMTLSLMVTLRTLRRRSPGGSIRSSLTTTSC